MKTMSKILAAILIVVLCVSLFTVQAYAAYGDDITDHKSAKAATCDEDGWPEYWVAGSDYYTSNPDTNGDGKVDDTSTETSTQPTEAKGHKMTEVAAVAATCTEAGNSKYYKCSVCGGLFEDADGNTPTTAAAVKIDATGHQNTTDVPEVKATCYSTGVKAHKTCDDCGALLDQSGTKETTMAKLTIPIDEEAHNWVKDDSKSKPATETHGGTTVYNCSICGATRSESTPPATGLPSEPAGNDLYYLVASRDTYYRGEELPSFWSDLIEKLNKQSGKYSNYVGVRIGTDKSLYANSYDTLDFWSSGNSITLGQKLVDNLDAGTYYIWVYNKNNQNEHTNSIPWYIVDTPTLDPINTDKHVVNSTKNLRFRASEPVQPGSVKVGGKSLLDDNYYYVSNDGLTITLSPDFLNERQPGNYTISANTVSDGTKVSSPFYILSTASASASPKTGDESQLGLWAAFLLLSGAAVVVLVPKIRKHGA